MENQENILREMLTRLGLDGDEMFSSDTLSEKEKINLLASTLDDVIKSQTNNSTKFNTGASATKNNCFYLGFVSDTHSKLFLLEKYFKLLSAIGGKCVVTGDVTNGSNHFHGHDNSLNESKNLTDDLLSTSDILARYKNMFIGYVEGNHDQWITEGTSLLVGYLACKIAKVDEIYAKNIQIVKQAVNLDGKEVPFHFLIVHGEGMPADVVKGLKKALTKACGENVDAVIFGHTHKIGSANTTVISKNNRGEWIEKRVGAYNPGSLLETSDYADKAGYNANTPFDGTIMRCSAVKNENGTGIKKCIDIENIMNLVSKEHRDMLEHLKGKLAGLEKTKFASKEELFDRYTFFRDVYLGDKSKFLITNDNGHFVVSINGTCDMFSPEVDEGIRNKIRQDLKTLVKVVAKLPNVSVALNGDLVYDYNKGYIEKKDYCSDLIADMQDLCEILKPIADKIVVINNGKMEKLIMDVERDKGNGRISRGKKLTELANYAVQSLQLDTKLAYAKYDPIEMHNLQVAAQNDKVNNANQDLLDKTFLAFMARFMRDPEVLHELDGYYVEGGKEKQARKIKLALAAKLKANHEILDITNEQDRKKIDELFPLSEIDLRMPNQNLMGNIFCKMLGISPTKTKVNFELGCPTTFKFKDGEKTKVAVASYTTSLPKFLKELSTKLTTTNNPPDVVVVNNAVTKLAPNQEEFTAPVRINYVDQKGVKRVKDVMVINSGGFSYGRCMENGRVAPNMIYKVVDVDPIFQTLVPKDSVNYAGDLKTRQVVEKYNCESVLQNNSVAELIVDTTIRQSLVRALDNFDQRNYISQNQDFINRFAENKAVANEETTQENDDENVVNE